MSLFRLWLVWFIASWFAYLFASSGFGIRDWQTYAISSVSFGLAYLASRPTKRVPDAGDSSQ